MSKSKAMTTKSIVTVTVPELKGMVTITGQGGGLKLDQDYEVSAELATNLINKGFAILKTK